MSGVADTLSRLHDITGGFQKTLDQPGVTVQLVTRIGQPTVGVRAAEPLWKRVPTHSDDGRPLGDFMMLIPRLREKPSRECARTVEALQFVLEKYRHVVVFAELNLPLNILWISLKPVPGMCLELATAIKLAVPEALLVAQKTSERGP
ncbi:MAG: hypothetical protein QNK18_17430 [Gammaproteobacteria bacterium]|nr:hypothetical protein [Gammaproteobacteria bacterium]